MITSRAYGKKMQMIPKKKKKRKRNTKLKIHLREWDDFQFTPLYLYLGLKWKVISSIQIDIPLSLSCTDARKPLG